MLHDLTVVQFTKMLTNLDAILEKGAAFAESRKIEMDVLLNSRLSADQFNLIRQVQIACDTAKLSVARLIDKEADAPKHDDSEKTLAELQTRIKSTIDYLSSVKPEDFASSVTTRVTQPRWKGKTLSGAEYAIQHAVPNICFHVTTAYAILRHNGVEVGKRDYLGTMPYKD